MLASSWVSVEQFHDYLPANLCAFYHAKVLRAFCTAPCIREQEDHEASGYLSNTCAVQKEKPQPHDDKHRSAHEVI